MVHFSLIYSAKLPEIISSLEQRKVKGIQIDQAWWRASWEINVLSVDYCIGWIIFKCKCLTLWLPCSIKCFKWREFFISQALSSSVIFLITTTEFHINFLLHITALHHNFDKSWYSLVASTSLLLESMLLSMYVEQRTISMASGCFGFFLDILGYETVRGKVTS